MLNKDYLYQILGSSVTYDQFERQARGGVVNNLNSNIVAKVKIPLPPPKEQKRIVATLDKAFEGLARARSNTEAKLRDIDDLQQSLLHRAFSGELA